MRALGVLSALVGWLTAVAVVVAIRSFVEYPLVQASGLETGAPTPALHLWARIGYGTLAAGIGGFVTAWLTPARWLLHALVLMIPVTVTAYLYSRPEWSAEPPGHDVAAILLPAAAVLAGAALRGYGSRDIAPRENGGES